MKKLVNSDTLISVYIPTYNRVDLLTRAVESVRAQTYSNLEIIIVDDCSTDGTHQYLEKIIKEDSRISFFIKEKNSGACVSRNIAIQKAKGIFITGLDDDDYFDKDRIKLFLREALKDENKIYFTSYKVKKSKNIIVKPNFLTVIKRSRILDPKLLLKKNYLGNQIFIKTVFLRQCGGFDETLKAWQDLECWYNLLKTQNIEASFIKKPTYTIDISHESERISSKNINNIIEAYNYFSMKHNLGFYEKFILQNQLVKYMPKNYSSSKKLLLFFFTGNRLLLNDIF